MIRYFKSPHIKDKDGYTIYAVDEKGWERVLYETEKGANDEEFFFWHDPLRYFSEETIDEINSGDIEITEEEAMNEAFIGMV